MDYLFEDTLPCLQSVAPWWSETDRRLIFCFLKAIFNLDSDYLAEHPAAIYENNGEERKLSSKEIDNEYKGLTKEIPEDKITCTRIRNTDFTFGKINARICNLCPYSRRYKNLKFFDERRILSFIMNRSDLSVSILRATNSTSIDKLFKSYFPVFYKDILIDAFPFSYIAKEFESLPAGNFVTNYKTEKDSIIEKVYSFFRESRTYNKKGICIHEYIPAYDEIILDAINTCFSFIEESTENNRDITFPHIKRIFNGLNNNMKYHPKKPSEFNILENNFDNVDVHKTYGLDELDLSDSDSTGEDVHELKSSSAIDYKDEPNEEVMQSVTDITMPVNILAEYEDNNFKALENLDLKNYCEGHNTNSEGITPLPLHHVSHHHEKNKKKQDMAKCDRSATSAYDTFHQYYEIGSPDNIFEYGTGEQANESVIFSIFMEDNSFLCMEPAILHEKKGILILNSRGEKLFYCIPAYGPKPIRNIEKQNIMVYSSNCYNLYNYLFKNKVYKLRLHDAGIAYSLSTGKKVRGIRDFTSLKFPECMNLYPEVYSSALSSLNKEQTRDLERMESFIPYLFTDGNKPPFSKMEKLCSMKDSLSFNYLYQNNAPIIEGMFLGIKATLDNDSSANIDYKKLYMDTCIDFNKRYPFHSGNINIVHLSSKALIFYLTGSVTEMQKIQLYISASTHRCFSTAQLNNANFIIEEKPLYTNKKNNHLVS